MAQKCSHRAKVKFIRAELGFESIDMDNFTNFAYQTHQHVLKRPVWGESNRDWRGIPVEEMQEAVSIMRERCGSLFEKRGKDVSSDQGLSAIDNRLYQARRGWKKGRLESLKRQKKSMTGSKEVNAEGEHSLPTKDVGTSDTRSSSRSRMEISAILS